MMPKQKPEKPAPPMAPSCAAVKPYSLPHAAKMPPRMAKPTPAARMARNPAQRSRLALGAIPSVFADMSVNQDWFGVEIGWDFGAAFGGEARGMTARAYGCVNREII